MQFFDLPVVVLEHIFSYLTYDEVAKNRIVCKDFDEMCKRILNHGFHMIERRHSLSLKTIKAMLPRRESERRFHNLARHCDVLTSVETRLSMLSMTYTKYIDNNMCCFIPGKVIDEISRVLAIVEQSHTIPRAHEVLQELRDISSMAIEHFDDRVAPKLRMKMLENSKAGPSCSAAQNGRTSQPTEPVETVKGHYIGHRTMIALLKRLHNMEKRMICYTQQLKMQKKLIILMSRKQNLQTSSIAELKKRVEECDVKYRELTQSQGGIKGITATTSHTDVDSQPPALRHYSSQIRLDPTTARSKRTGRADSPNIKPRKTTLDRPSLDALSQSLKRPRLSMEDSGSSNSSQDIHDITDKSTPINSSSLAETDDSGNVQDFKTALSKVPNIRMAISAAKTNADASKVGEDDDCILIMDSDLD